MFPAKSRRMLKSGTSSLPPCAPSAVPSFCLRLQHPVHGWCCQHDGSLYRHRPDAGRRCCSAPACTWIVPASWNACWTRSQATATTSRWTSCLPPQASMPQRGVLQWKAPFPTVTLVPTPTSTTAPLPLWCAVLRPSRPSSRNRSPRPPQNRHQRTSTPPFCSSCGRPTTPFRTR